MLSMMYFMMLLACSRAESQKGFNEHAGAVVHASGEVVVRRHDDDIEQHEPVRARNRNPSGAEAKTFRELDDAVAKAATFLVREAAPPSFLAAPAGSTQNLFIPAIHRCNEKLKAEFLTAWPLQAVTTETQKGLEDNLRLVHDVFAELGMPTILARGSVLGFFRNCHVIPRDRDGDVAVLGHWLQGKRSIANLAKAFAARNANLNADMCAGGPQNTGCELHVYHNNLHIDLFVYATESACDEAPCSFFGSYHKTDKEGVATLPTFNKDRSGKIHFEQADFLDRMFWIPTPTLDYIVSEYGLQWTYGLFATEPSNKAVEFSKETTSGPDIYGDTMPPPEYVLSLEQTGRMREQQLLTAIAGQ